MEEAKEREEDEEDGTGRPDPIVDDMYCIAKEEVVEDVRLYFNTRSTFSLLGKGGQKDSPTPVAVTPTRHILFLKKEGGYIPASTSAKPIVSNEPGPPQ